MPEDGEDVEEILARGKRLADPFECVFDEGYDFVPAVRDVYANTTFTITAENVLQCGGARSNPSDKLPKSHHGKRRHTHKRICSRKSEGVFSNVRRNLWASRRCTS